MASFTLEQWYYAHRHVFNNFNGFGYLPGVPYTGICCGNLIVIKAVGAIFFSDSLGELDVSCQGHRVCATCGLVERAGRMTAYSAYAKPYIAPWLGRSVLQHNPNNAAIANELLAKTKATIAAKQKPQRLCQCGAWAVGAPDHSAMHDNTRTFTCPAFKG